MKTLQMEDIYWGAEIALVRDTPLACSRCTGLSDRFLEVRVRVPHAPHFGCIILNLPCGHSSVAADLACVAPPDVLAALMLAATPTTYL